MELNKLYKVFAAIVICQLAGVLGSLFTYQSMPALYASLQKPLYAPPGWVFGPAWLTLYTLMGISLYLVWAKGLDDKEVKNAILIFGIQLGLNSIWSPIFFSLKNFMFAFIEILVLWAFIAATIFSFHKISKRAAWLLVPYILWVSFAAMLNYSVWMLNM